MAQSARSHLTSDLHSETTEHRPNSDSLWETATTRPEESIDWMSRFDPVTHLMHRKVFDLRLQKLLSGRPGDSAAVLAFRLQRFELMEAMYGLHATLRLLRLVAGRIAGLARSGETISRSRDDEYLVLTPVSSVDHLARIVSRYETAFCEPFDLGKESVHVDASFGVARAPHDGGSPEALVGAALAALHHAHRVLLTSVCFFEPSMRPESTGVGKQTRFREASGPEEQLLVEYQPQVNLETGRMVSVEALVRWTRTSERLPLSQFLRFAAYLGVRDSWVETVLRRACRGVANCIRRPETLYGGIGVAVNLDPCELLDDALPERIARCLESAEFEANSLVLELPAEFRPRDLPYCSSNLRRLRSLGVQICLADCRSSARCLSLLSRFPFDRVRLEKTLVAMIGAQTGDTSARATVIVGLAENFGAMACADGVETATQAETLRQIGCHAGQGRLFSAPVAEDQLAQLLAGSGAPSRQEPHDQPN